MTFFFRALSICHFLLAALVAMHGALLVLSTLRLIADGDQPYGFVAEPLGFVLSPFRPWSFILLSAVLVAVLLWNGWSLRQRNARSVGSVVAALFTTFIVPTGTVLGAATILLLLLHPEQTKRAEEI